MTGATRTRCAWATSHPLEQVYHDQEWGVPRGDEAYLFELLSLEGAQAGLSWLTVLKKRKNYRDAFFNFDWRQVAVMDSQDVDRMLEDPGLIRHRGKLESVINNARAIAKLHDQGRSLGHLIWSLTNGQTLQHEFSRLEDVPARSDLSEQLSKTLKRTGFRFVGPTTCYAFLQAVGVVNDHITDCFRHQQVADLARNFRAPAS